MDWIKINPNNVRKYCLADEPEVIYIIELGFRKDDTTTADYMVVHEDAYQYSLGNVYLLTKQQLKEIYDIEY